MLSATGVLVSQEAPVQIPAPSILGQKEEGAIKIPGGGWIHVKKRTVVLPAEILMNAGLIELFACAPGGKEHESIMRVNCDPRQLNLALIMCKLKDGGLPGAEVAEGTRVIIFARWLDKESNVHEIRIEDMIYNQNIKSSMPRIGWTYLGSMMEPELNHATGEPTGRSVFMADQSKSLITTYRDATTILDNPMPDAFNDDLYHANPEVIPPLGTHVKLIIRAANEEELKAIKTIETETRKKIREATAPAPKEEEKK